MTFLLLATLLFCKETPRPKEDEEEERGKSKIVVDQQLRQCLDFFLKGKEQDDDQAQESHCLKGRSR